MYSSVARRIIEQKTPFSTPLKMQKASGKGDQENEGQSVEITTEFYLGVNIDSIISSIFRNTQCKIAIRNSSSRKIDGKLRKSNVAIKCACSLTRNHDHVGIDVSASIDNEQRERLQALMLNCPPSLSASHLVRCTLPTAEDPKPSSQWLKAKEGKGSASIISSIIACSDMGHSPTQLARQKLNLRSNFVSARMSRGLRNEPGILKLFTEYIGTDFIVIRNTEGIFVKNNLAATPDAAALYICPSGESSESDAHYAAVLEIKNPDVLAQSPHIDWLLQLQVQLFCCETNCGILLEKDEHNVMRMTVVKCAPEGVLEFMSTAAEAFFLELEGFADLMLQGVSEDNAIAIICNKKDVLVRAEMCEYRAKELEYHHRC